MWRNLYYKLSPRWRFLARWLYYLPQDLLFPSDPDIPPRRYIYTGRGDFKKQGKEWLAYFKALGSLSPQDHFLDIGSGIGRIAIPLTTYLKAPYEGFDVVPLGIRWCTDHIQRRYPHFRFQYVPLYNDLYTSDGQRAQYFRFPYAENSFDFVCAISVFTHLVPEELENYLAECFRVSRIGCRWVFTFFILQDITDPAEQSAEASFQFPYRKDHRYAWMDRSVQSANVAYHRVYLEGLFSRYGLEILNFERGYWSGAPKKSELAFQDIYVLKLPAKP
jgi:SAM-dependent methyltransferase